MPTEEAGYTYAVEPAATDRLLANEEESIYGLSCNWGNCRGREFGTELMIRNVVAE